MLIKEITKIKGNQRKIKGKSKEIQGNFAKSHLGRAGSRSQIEDRRKSKLKIKKFGWDQNVVKIMIPKFHLGLRLLCQYKPQKSNLAIRFFWTPNSAY